MRVPRSVAVLGLSIAVASTALLRTHTAAELFDPTRLHEVRLVISPEDVQRRRTAYADNTSYPDDFARRRPADVLAQVATARTSASRF